MKEGPMGRAQVPEGPVMKRAVLYLRVSTADQSPEMQRDDLERLAAQRGLAIVETYVDQASGAKARRPGLERMMADARHAKFDVVLVWACDRLARSTSHFLQTLDELGHWGVEFASFREALDTSGALGRAVVTIIAVVAELERSLIRERVKGGLRRARLEGKHLGRPRMVIDREALLRDRAHGASLSALAASYRISRASVSKVLRAAKECSHKTSLPRPPQALENRQSESAG